MFDVKAGRNPITSGGIQGPYSFAPLDLPPVQQVASPVAGAVRVNQAQGSTAPGHQAQVNQPPVSPAPARPACWTPAVLPCRTAPLPARGAAPQPAPVAATPHTGASHTPRTGQQPPTLRPGPALHHSHMHRLSLTRRSLTGHSHTASKPPSALGSRCLPRRQPRWPSPAQPSPGPFQPAPSQAFPVPGLPSPSRPSPGRPRPIPTMTMDRTQMRGGAHAYSDAGSRYCGSSSTTAVTSSSRQNVIVGRNPVGQTGGSSSPRSWSWPLPTPDARFPRHTFTLLTEDGAGIWVTDRNSTNGSAVTTPDGQRTPPWQPGVPAFVSPGSTVHFGDRSFHLGQA